MLAALLLAGLAVAAPVRPDLTGTVVDSAGKPVSGATVFIYTAAVRTGTSVYCPSCYPDCAKRATTDADGRFVIRTLDPDLLFQVLVLTEGYVAKSAKKVDPADGPLAVTVVPRDVSKLPPAHVLRGRVADDKGRPVAGAVLNPRSFKTSGYEGFSPDILDPVAVTNDRGEFVLTSKQPLTWVTFRVEARGFAPVLTPQFTPDRSDQTVTTTRGAFVTGRVVRDGKPVKDVILGLCQADHRADVFLGHEEIGTDNGGEFLFSNVAPNREYVVYGLMDGLKGSGAIPAKRVRVGADGTTTEVGDVAVGPGYRLAGQVVLADGKPVPPRTRLLVSLDNGEWDSQTIELDADGRFEVRGLPAGLVSAGVSVPGYRLSDQNVSLDPLGGRSLIGRVNQDIDGLLVHLEPGPVRGPVPFTSGLTTPWSEAVERQKLVMAAPLGGPIPPAAGVSAGLGWNWWVIAAGAATVTVAAWPVRLALRGLPQRLRQLDPQRQ
jgi:protocatechuate 3,4-dioxygenase beta subunit